MQHLKIVSFRYNRISLNILLKIFKNLKTLYKMYLSKLLIKQNTRTNIKSTIRISGMLFQAGSVFNKFNHELKEAINLICLFVL